VCVCVCVCVWVFVCVTALTLQVNVCKNLFVTTLPVPLGSQARSQGHDDLWATKITYGTQLGPFFAFLVCSSCRACLSDGVPIPALSVTSPDLILPPDVLLLLQRIMEHFASGCLSLQPSRAMHAVRIVVSAAIAAIADAVLRQPATDHVSSVGAHLKV
jgi:hypothetical protein